MAEPFDNTSPGNETRRYADYIDPVAADDLYAGEAVTLDASGKATLAGPEDYIVGIVYINQISGKRVTVKTRGTVVARVSTNVAVGGTAGGHLAAGAAGEDSDAVAGDLSNAGDEYYVLDAGQKEDPRAGDGTLADYAEVDKL